MFKASYRSTPRPRHERARRLLSGDAITAANGPRDCAYPGCGVRLSRYNPATTCFSHGGWQLTPEPGRRPRRHVL